MSSNNNQDDKKPFSVNVDWTPGETGKNPNQDKEPSSWSRLWSPNKQYYREMEKTGYLIDELKKTDPALIKKVAELIEGNPRFDQWLNGGIDKDNFLSPREVGAISTRNDYRISTSYEDTLNHIDLNKDGKVTVDELRENLKKYVVEETGHEFKAPTGAGAKPQNTKGR